MATPNEVYEGIKRGDLLKCRPEFATVGFRWEDGMIQLALPQDCIEVVDAHPTIERVIFKPPATVVFWSDKMKTVVRCSECDSPKSRCAYYVGRGLCKRETGGYIEDRAEWEMNGLMAALVKRAYGNKAPDMIRKALESAERIGDAE